MRQYRIAGLIGLFAVAAAVSGGALAAANGGPEPPEDKALIEIQKSTPMLAAPEKDAEVIETVAPGTQLVLLTHKRHGAYYRVIRVNRGPVGWVHNEAAKIAREVEEVDDLPDEEKCAETLAECPAQGCAKDKPDEAKANVLKRRVPTAALKATLNVADFLALQKLADERVGQGPPDLTEAQRARLFGLSVHGGTVAEGDVVRAFGYLAKGDKGLHVNAHGESVNCNLKGKSSNDFHIPLVGKADDPEFKGIVVEMIPQDRPEAWTIESLEAVRDKGQEVWVEGALLYDKEHYVSDNPDDPLSRDPNRASLWEIHPITKFLVCRKEHCERTDEKDWSAL